MSEDLDWLLDVTLPLIIDDKGWRKKRDQVMALPKWFREPSDHVKQVFAWLRREPGVIEPQSIDWQEVKAHIEKDFIAFLWHFCFFKTRDPPVRLELATPSASQLILAWRFQVLWHKNMPVRLDLLKERQGGFSWLITQMVGWLTFFVPRQGALQIAQDKETTKRVFRYLKDLHEKLPTQIRPADEYSSRTELVLREAKEERLKGNEGLDSTITVATAGNEFAGTGQPIQILHISEVGKWHEVCDPNILATSLINAVQFLPGTFVFRESTAHGEGTYWHVEWQASLKMGKKGWNGYTPVFLPWYLDDRNALKAPPDMQLSQVDSDENGNETAERARYNLSNEQLEWRRRNIEKQADGLRKKLHSFQQEHPGNAIEAWLAAFGKWLDPDFIATLRKRREHEEETGLLRSVYVGDLMHVRSKGMDLGFLKEGQQENEWLRRRQGGPFTIFRLPDWRFDYVIGVDIAFNVGGDYSCAKVYQRVGGPRDGGALLRLAAEWYGHADDDQVAHILWRLGYFYSVGNKRDRLPAMLAWERTGAGMAIAKWLRKGEKGEGTDSYPPSRMYRRHNPNAPKFTIDKAFGINTNEANKIVMLKEWVRLTRDGDIQLTQPDIDEATTLVVDDRNRVNTQGRDRFMASMMAVYASQYTPVLYGREEKKTDEPKPHTVAWALQMEQVRQTDSRRDMEERIFGFTED